MNTLIEAGKKFLDVASRLPDVEYNTTFCDAAAEFEQMIQQEIQQESEACCGNCERWGGEKLLYPWYPVGWPCKDSMPSFRCKFWQAREWKDEQV